MKIVFISPCFNAAKNIHKLVGSTKCQSDDRWSHIIIDDMSEDATVEVVDRVIVNDSRYELIINNEKKYALRNIVESARKYQDEDDVVIVDGRPGRITRVHLTKTVFYLYTYREGILVGGTKMAVPNTALKSMRIEKPLEKLEPEDYWKWSEAPNGGGANKKKSQ